MDRFRNSKDQVARIKSAGFTLIEVLVSIGLLGTLVITVAYMTISNQSELLRHNAESYADLIASQQFSELVAYRDQIAFDNNINKSGQNEVTNWNNKLYGFGSSPFCMKDDGRGGFILHTPAPCETPDLPLDKQGGGINLGYSMDFSKMQTAGVEDKNLLKVHLTITYNDRGGERSKEYYTVIANYL